jgi:hypothetical protein
MLGCVCVCVAEGAGPGVGGKPTPVPTDLFCIWLCCVSWAPSVCYGCSCSGQRVVLGMHVLWRGLGWV